MSNRSFLSGRSCNAAGNHDRFATGPLLVATDGSTSSEAFPTLLSLLARHLQTEVEVLSVIEPIPLMGGYPSPPACLGDIVDTGGHFGARPNRSGSSASTAGSPVDVIGGNPLDLIVRQAREREARLMIVGLNHHDTLTRRHDARSCPPRRCSVLAVSPGAQITPSTRRRCRRFQSGQRRGDAGSAEAAGRACNGLPCARVKVSAELRLTELAMWDRRYDVALPEAFDRVTEGLDIPVGMRIERVTLRGNAPRSILEFAPGDPLMPGSTGCRQSRARRNHADRRECRHSPPPRDALLDPDRSRAAAGISNQILAGNMWASCGEMPDWSCRGISPSAL